MKFNDAISGVVLLLFAGALFYFTRDFPQMPGQAYGPSLFPRLLATVLALCSLWLIVTGIRQRAGAPWVQLEAWTRSPRHLLNAATVIGVVVFYILVSDWLGFLITGFAGLLTMLLVIRGPRHWKSALFIAVVTVLVMHQFFYTLLRVPLPWGVLEQYAW